MDQMQQQLSGCVQDYPASTMLAAFGGGLVVGTIIALQFLPAERTYQQQIADAGSTAFQRAREALMCSVKSLQDAVSKHMA
jgi:hypothetical protein